MNKLKFLHFTSENQPVYQINWTKTISFNEFRANALSWKYD